MGKITIGLLSGIAGIVLGFLVGGGAGGLVGSGVGAVTGAYLGVCKTVIVAADEGLVDAATADRIATAVLARLRAETPELVKTSATDLATCRTEKGIEMLDGKPAK